MWFCLGPGTVIATCSIAAHSPASPFLFPFFQIIVVFYLFVFTPTSWSSIAACVQAITGYHSSYKPQEKYLFNYGWQLLPLNTMHLLKSRYRFQNVVICQIFTDYESWTSIENHLYKEVQADLERQFETLIGSVTNSKFSNIFLRINFSWL